MTTTAARRPTTGELLCDKHAEFPAGWQCSGCGALFCDYCMKEGLRERARRLESCPKCHSFCNRVADDGPKGPGSMGAIFADTIAYPTRGHGIALIMIGGLFLGFLDCLTMGI